MFSHQLFEAEITRHAHLPYLLHTPQGQAPAEGWPLLLFLHGFGERGLDYQTFEERLPSTLAARLPSLPYYVAAPICPADSFWLMELNALSGLLADLKARLRPDLRRIWLTGLSMGGAGAWWLATAEPHTFAALVPICGGGDNTRVAALKDLSVWAFHGDQDTIVPLSATVNTVEALNQAGGKAKMTIYAGVDHDSWTPAYGEDALFAWLAEQARP
jgi:predicted peptidase